MVTRLNLKKPGVVDISAITTYPFLECLDGRQNVKNGKITAAYDRVKNQVGYCGIWCGSCVVGNGTLRQLAKGLQEITTGYGLADWGPKDFNFDEFTKGLASLQNLPLCTGCRMGGGRDNCPIRSCALENKLPDCLACNDPMCKNADEIKKMQSGAVSAGLFVKTENRRDAELIDEWTDKLKSSWPCLVLFVKNSYDP
jgi:hypothetical protein